MNHSTPTPSLAHRFVAATVLVHVLAALALAASPRLHHWVHPDEDDDDGDCAVVLFLHGGCDQAPAPLVVPVCVDAWHPVAAIVAAPVRVPSVFAVCGVLEHAPPDVSILPPPLSSVVA